jgi:hypothetical protein
VSAQCRLLLREKTRHCRLSLRERTRVVEHQPPFRGAKGDNGRPFAERKATVRLSRVKRHQGIKGSIVLLPLVRSSLLSKLVRLLWYAELMAVAGWQASRSSGYNHLPDNPLLLKTCLPPALKKVAGKSDAAWPPLPKRCRYACLDNGLLYSLIPPYSRAGEPSAPRRITASGRRTASS